MSSSQQPEQMVCRDLPSPGNADPNTLRAEAQQLATIAGDVERTAASLRSAMAALESEWSSPGFQALCSNCWAPLITRYDNLASTLRTAIAHIITAASDIESAQRERTIAIATLAATAGIGIALTIITFGASDVAAAEAAAVEGGIIARTVAAIATVAIRIATLFDDLATAFRTLLLIPTAPYWASGVIASSAGTAIATDPFVQWLIDQETSQPVGMPGKSTVIEAGGKWIWDEIDGWRRDPEGDGPIGGHSVEDNLSNLPTPH